MSRYDISFSSSFPPSSPLTIFILHVINYLITEKFMHIHSLVFLLMSCNIIITQIIMVPPSSCNCSLIILCSLCAYSHFPAVSLAVAYGDYRPVARIIIRRL
eukprot:TRINITY_DN10373_c1_g1_i11.p3 TRINITY_DN10373_c1_g1~~TRINITY_DN10373_c1_g1_i11.p3  ORF type:complete len:102 (+),score=9.33 TRINITY_DN10373_c1_g1_i11:2476-2781(+)